jgi:DNA-directed RNA polymerase subunit beta'
VRTGKSTFIHRFLDSVVLPNIENEYDRERTLDQIPQSATGRTVMTTEPKFVPDESVQIGVGETLLNVKMIDCVGYMVEGALGSEEDGQQRMIMTPWSEVAMPFTEAAELGTSKVIGEHSTIGMLVTTDGSITDIPRESYVKAEERVAEELKKLGKPFAIVLNSANPGSDEAKALAPEKIARERAKVEAEAIGTVYNQNYDYAGDALREAELDRYELETGAILECPDGAVVKENTPIVRWDAYNVPIIAERAGKVVLRDLIAGVTLGVQKRGASEEPMVMEHRDDLHPQVVLTDADGEFLVSYPLPAGALLMVKSGVKVKAGMTIARVPRSSAKNKDITGGLPRIAELFEARMPKDVAEIARIDGEVTEDVINRNRRRLVIVDKESGQVEEHNNIPANRHLTVSKGDMVHKGQKLTEGSVVPQALLEVCGAQELQRYLVNEIQMVYRAQGVEINDKHIEIIIRQMMQKIRVKDSGDSEYLPGEQIDRFAFEAANKALRADGKKPATGDPILLGITKASLETESFISAASFQDTTRILTEAATIGKIDNLNGFKENVITGHLIPAGTGTERMQSIRLKYLGTEIEPDPEELVQERSIEDIQAAWRDSDGDADNLKDMFADEDGEEFDLPDEAKELVPEFEEDGFSTGDDEFGDEL